MKSKIVKAILTNEKTVRQIIDEAVLDTGSESTEIITTEPVENEPTDAEYRHLFVRRWKTGEDKPYKRAKLSSANEAINLFFDWANKYRNDKVEIWSDVASDAKNFYRFCLKNREVLGDTWKQSARIKKTGLFWPAAYRDIQSRSRQSGNNLVGTLYPFEVK